MIQTGLPRHSTVSFSPSFSAEMSTSTAAPAALAFSEGWKLLTKGTATKPAPTAPAHPDAISHVRLLASIGVSLMGVLKDSRDWVNPRLYLSAMARFNGAECVQRNPLPAYSRDQQRG